MGDEGGYQNNQSTMITVEAETWVMGGSGIYYIFLNLYMFKNIFNKKLK